MKVTMTKREIRTFFIALQTLAPADAPRKFAYVVAHNRKTVRKVHDALVEATKPLPDFEEQRVALARSMAKKDPDGEPIMLPNNQGYFVPDMGKFEEALKAIKKSTGQDKVDAETEELFNEEQEIDVYMVAFEYLPEKIRPDLLEAVLIMVHEPADPPTSVNSN